VRIPIEASRSLSVQIPEGEQKENIFIVWRVSLYRRQPPRPLVKRRTWADLAPFEVVGGVSFVDFFTRIVTIEMQYLCALFKISRCEISSFDAVLSYVRPAC
jgi:hypothetical protein